MKKFVIKSICFLVFCLALLFIPSVSVDPYNVFHYKSIRNNGIEPNKNYVKTRYILDNPEKYDCFVLGSSRVGAIHSEKISDVNAYNMTYPNGTPEECLETVQTFVNAGVNIKRIYLGVDSMSYTENTESHYLDPLRCPYQKLDMETFASLYINPMMVVQSIKTIRLHQQTPGFDVFYDYGWWCDYDANTSTTPQTWEPSVGKGYYMDDALEAIEDLTSLCIEYDIELVVFTNPMCEITYYKSKEDLSYLLFLEQLASIHEYYNFSGINEITTNMDNYLDSSHYNAYIGDTMIGIMSGDVVLDTLYDDGFGWIVNQDNVEQLIGVLCKQ